MTESKAPTYEVLARKYRPRQFGEVVGQQHVTATLSSAIASGRIAHAYLFVGPRGIGKTSIARILAKALNCREGPTSQPCDACDSCLEIAAGRSLDVMEIDGASNNGVDQVRDLRDSVRYAPARDPFKIYVIDEVHMLSIAAFNALLKTLEEPPRHVKFFFATTEPQKVPATIASRCQRFDLRRISAGDLIGQLRKIAGEEGVRVEEDALLAVARGAEGGMRDAESALDQLIAFCGGAIREEDVLSVFGLVSRGELEALARAVLEGDYRGLLAAVAALDRAGKDLQRVLIELLEHFRNVLVVQHAGDAPESLGVTGPQIGTLREHARKVEASALLRIVEELIETDGRLRYSLSRRTLLETSLIRCARVAASVPIEAVIRELAALRAGLDLPGASAPAPAPDPAPPAPPTPAGPEDPARAWSEALPEIGNLVPRIAGSLRGSKVWKTEGDRVDIAVDPGRIPDPANWPDDRDRRAVEKALSRKLARSVSVRFVHAPSGPAPSEPAPDKGAGDRRSRVPKAVHSPDVDRVIDLFGGSIVDDSGP